MDAYRLWTSLFLGQVMLGVTLAAPPDAMLPVTTPPIVYTINYSGEYFKTVTGKNKLFMPFVAKE